MPLLVTSSLLLSILIFNGCNCADTSSSGKKQDGVIQQNSQNQTEKSLEVKEEGAPKELSIINEQFIISNSQEKKGWKEVAANVPLNEMIYDGNSRGSTDLEGDRTVKYILCFPASWTMSGTVFLESNHKVAELGPVVLLKQGEEAEFLDYKTVEGEVILKESIYVAEYKGAKIILKLDTEKGSWYPHMYILSDGTFGFTMTMYSKKQIRDEDEEKLFDDIVNTFKFVSGTPKPSKDT